MSFTDKQIDALVHIICDIAHAEHDSLYSDDIRASIKANIQAYYDFCSELQKTYTEEQYIDTNEAINVLILHDPPVVNDVEHWNSRVLTEVMQQPIQYTINVAYTQTGIPLGSEHVSAILNKRLATVTEFSNIQCKVNETLHTITYSVECCDTVSMLEEKAQKCIDGTITPFTCLDNTLTFSSRVVYDWYGDNDLYDLEQHLLKERAEIREQMKEYSTFAEYCAAIKTSQ